MNDTETTPHTSSHRFITLLKNKNFFRLWLGQIVASIGDRFYQFAILYVVLKLTPGGGMGRESARVLFSGMILTVILFPWIGRIVDTHCRKNLMLLTDIARALLVLSMLAVWVIWKSPPLMFLFIAITGLMNGIFIPARQASVPMLVPKKDLISANALVTVIGVIASIFGGCAGFIVAIFGENSSFIITAIGFLFSAWMIFRISSPLRPSSKPAETLSWHILWVTSKNIIKDRTILFLFILSGGAQFITGLFLIFAIEYASTNLDLTLIENTFSSFATFISSLGFKQPTVKDIRLIALILMLFSTGLGLVAGVFVSSSCYRLAHWQALPIIMFSGLGISFLGLSQAESFETALLCSLLIGFAGALLTIPIESRLQAHVHGDNHGRIFAAKTAWTYICFLTALAINLSGYLLEIRGPQQMLLDLAIASILLTLILITFYPKTLTRSWQSDLS